MPKDISSINIKITGTNTELVNAIRGSNVAINNLGKTTKKTNDLFSGGAAKLSAYITRVAAAYAVLETFRQALRAIGDSVALAAAAQDAQVSFSVMLGSSRTAERALRDIYKFVETTPFRLTEVVDASKTLIAFGFSAKEVIPTLRQIGDISAGVGVPVTELATLLGKARVEGRQYTRDLRQFATAGIPIYRELAKQLRVSTATVQEFAEEGFIGARNVELAIASLTAEGSQFGGLMAERAKTLSGQFSNLQDSIDSLKRALGTELIPVLTDFVEKATFATEALRDMDLSGTKAGFVIEKLGNAWSFLMSNITAPGLALKAFDFFTADSLEEWKKVKELQNELSKEISTSSIFFDPVAEKNAREALNNISDMQKESAKLAKKWGSTLRTPLETFKKNLAEIALLKVQGDITDETYQRGLAEINKQLEDESTNLDRIRHKRLGLTEIGSQAGFEALINSKDQGASKRPEIDIKAESAAALREATNTLRDQRDVADSVVKPAIARIEKATKELDRLQARINELFRDLAEQQIGMSEAEIEKASKRISDLVEELRDLEAQQNANIQLVAGLDESYNFSQPLRNLPRADVDKTLNRDFEKLLKERGEIESRYFRAIVENAPINEVRELTAELARAYEVTADFQTLMGSAAMTTPFVTGAEAAKKRAQLEKERLEILNDIAKQESEIATANARISSGEVSPQRGGIELSHLQNNVTILEGRIANIDSNLRGLKFGRPEKPESPAADEFTGARGFIRWIDSLIGRPPSERTPTPPAPGVRAAVEDIRDDVRDFLEPARDARAEVAASPPAPGVRAAVEDIRDDVHDFLEPVRDARAEVAETRESVQSRRPNLPPLIRGRSEPQSSPAAIAAEAQRSADEAVAEHRAFWKIYREREAAEREKAEKEGREPQALPSGTSAEILKIVREGQNPQALPSSADEAVAERRALWKINRERDTSAEILKSVREGQNPQALPSSASEATTAVQQLRDLVAKGELEKASIEPTTGKPGSIQTPTTRESILPQFGTHSGSRTYQGARDPSQMIGNKIQEQTNVVNQQQKKSDKARLESENFGPHVDAEQKGRMESHAITEKFKLRDAKAKLEGLKLQEKHNKENEAAFQKGVDLSKKFQKQDEDTAKDNFKNITQRFKRERDAAGIKGNDDILMIPPQREAETMDRAFKKKEEHRNRFKDFAAPEMPSTDNPFEREQAATMDELLVLWQQGVLTLSQISRELAKQTKKDPITVIETGIN